MDYIDPKQYEAWAGLSKKNLCAAFGKSLALELIVEHKLIRLAESCVRPMTPSPPPSPPPSPRPSPSGGADCELRGDGQVLGKTESPVPSSLAPATGFQDADGDTKRD
ncbi:hypothetical protein NX059_001858 [Plenodomus lindquistii]|nr:hypothetical protein NX059_001858 [Plenodomus lindquistii]